MNRAPLRLVPGGAVSDTATRTCAASKRPHPASDGGYLCRPHLDDLGRILRQIEDETRDVDPRPSLATRWDVGGGGLASEQAPVRLDPVALADHRRGGGTVGDETAWSDTRSVHATLTAWAGKVRTGRGLTPPTATVVIGRAPRPPALTGPVCDRVCGHDTCGPWITDTVRAHPTIRGERELLTRHLDWVAQQPWAGDAYRDLRGLRDQLQGVNGTRPDRPLPGHCPALVNNTECGGPLWPAKPTHTTGEWTGSSPSAVRCAACGTRWEGAGPLARLALIVEDQKRRKEAAS